MAEKKKFRDITLNNCTFQGEIAAAPQFNGGYGFATLEVSMPQRQPNGQWVENIVNIPLMFEPESRALQTLESKVEVGQRVHVETQYIPYESGGTPQHVFKVMFMKLGGKPYKPQNDQVPPLPG